MLLFVKDLPLLEDGTYYADETVGGVAGELDGSMQLNLEKAFSSNSRSSSAGSKSGRSSRASQKKESVTASRNSPKPGKTVGGVALEVEGEQGAAPTYLQLIDDQVQTTMTLLKEPGSTAAIVDEDTFNHYLQFTAEFTQQRDTERGESSEVVAPVDKANRLLGIIVEKAIRTASGAPTTYSAPSVTRSPLSIVLLGAPYSGKRTQVPTNAIARFLSLSLCHTLFFLSLGAFPMRHLQPKATQHR